MKHGCDIWNSCSPYGTLRIASTQAHTEETHRAATPYCMPCSSLLLKRNLGSGFINHNLQVEKPRHTEAHKICLPETQCCRKHLASQQKGTACGGERLIPGEAAQAPVFKDGSWRLRPQGCPCRCFCSVEAKSQPCPCILAMSRHTVCTGASCQVAETRQESPGMHREEEENAEDRPCLLMSAELDPRMQLHSL